jgi:hypothetical protein
MFTARACLIESLNFTAAGSRPFTAATLRSGSASLGKWCSRLFHFPHLAEAST